MMMLYFLLLIKDNWKRFFNKLAEIFRKDKPNDDPMPRKSTKYQDDDLRDEEESDIASENLEGFLPGPEYRNPSNSFSSYSSYVGEIRSSTPPTSRTSFSSLPSLDLTISSGLQAQKRRQTADNILQDLAWKRTEVIHLFKKLIDLLVSGEKPAWNPPLETQLKAKLLEKDDEPRLMPELPKRTQRSMLISYNGYQLNAKEYFPNIRPGAKKLKDFVIKKDDHGSVTFRKYLYEQAIYKNPLAYLSDMCGMNRKQTMGALRTSEEIQRSLKAVKEAVSEIIKKPTISEERKMLNWDKDYTLFEPTDLESVQIYSGRNRHLFMEKYDLPRSKKVGR